MGKEIAKLWITINANTGDIGKKMTAISKDLKKFGQDFQNLGKGMMITGGAMLAPIIAMSKSFADTANDIQSMAKATGTSTKFMSELSYVAKQTDTDFETLSSNFSRLSAVIQDASAGSKTAIATLQKMGVSLKDVKGLSSEDTFYKIADAIGKMPDGLKKTDAMVELFGRSGAKLAELLDGGSESIKNMVKEGYSLNAILSATDIKAGTELYKAFQDLTSQIGVLAGSVVSILGPSFKTAMEWIGKLINAFKWIININPALLKTFTLIAGVVTILGTAIFALGTAMKAYAMIINNVLVKAILKWVAAQLAALGISGPAGWAMIAAGLATAAIAYTAINAMINKANTTKGLAEGGIAMKPMTANIAENQPEVVLPLSRLNEFTNNNNMNVNVYLDGEQITNSVEKHMDRRIRLQRK